MINEYKGFSTFAEVEVKELRAYNRCMTFLNIFQIHGRQEATAYIQLFPLEERVDVQNIINRIKEVGQATVKREVACLAG